MNDKLVKNLKDFNYFYVTICFYLTKCVEMYTIYNICLEQHTYFTW